MKQQQSTYSIILWILFGFALINAIHAIVVAFIYTYLHYGFSDNFVEIHFQYYLPAFSFIISLIFSVFLIWFLTRQLQKLSTESSYFPKYWFFFSVLIALGLKPLTLSFSDNKLKALFEDLSKTEYLSYLNLDAVYRGLFLCTEGSLWLIFFILLCYFYLRLKRAKE